MSVRKTDKNGYLLDERARLPIILWHDRGPRAHASQPVSTVLRYLRTIPTYCSSPNLRASERASAHIRWRGKQLELQNMDARAYIIILCTLDYVHTVLERVSPPREDTQNLGQIGDWRLPLFSAICEQESIHTYFCDYYYCCHEKIYHRSSTIHTVSQTFQFEAVKIINHQNTIAIMPLYHQEEVPASFSSDGGNTEFLIQNIKQTLEPHGQDPIGTAHSSYSIDEKPTRVTLAETLSHGSGQHSHDESPDAEYYEYPEGGNGQHSHDESPDAEYYQHPEGLELPESGTLGYTVFDTETQEYSYYENQAQDNYNQEYSSYDNERRDDYTEYENDEGHYNEERGDHQQFDENQAYSADDGLPYNPSPAQAMHQRDNNQYWEETSMGYETCASRTLNTNLEGVNYIGDSVMMHEHELDTIQEPQQYRHCSEYEENYDDQHNGHQQFYDEEGQPFDSNDHRVDQVVESSHHRSIAESSVVSEPIESYESEDSESSWEEGSARDVSLMESGSQDGFESSDDDDDFSDDDSRRQQRRRRPTNIREMFKHFKDCALKAASESFDNDFEFLPDVAQISSAISSRTDMSDESEDGTRGSRRRRQKNSEKLFAHLSALGEELLGSDNQRSKKNKRGKSSRRRSKDPAANIIKSLAGMFSCGAPDYR